MATRFEFQCLTEGRDESFSSEKIFGMRKIENEKRRSAFFRRRKLQLAERTSDSFLQKIQFSFFSGKDELLDFYENRKIDGRKETFNARRIERNPRTSGKIKRRARKKTKV